MAKKIVISLVELKGKMVVQIETNLTATEMYEVLTKILRDLYFEMVETIKKLQPHIIRPSDQEVKNIDTRRNGNGN